MGLSEGEEVRRCSLEKLSRSGQTVRVTSPIHGQTVRVTSPKQGTFYTTLYFVLMSK